MVRICIDQERRSSRPTPSSALGRRLRELRRRRQQGGMSGRWAASSRALDRYSTGLHTSWNMGVCISIYIYICTYIYISVQIVHRYVDIDIDKDIDIEQTPKSSNIGLGRFVMVLLFSRLWGWRIARFQLSCFYCVNVDQNSHDNHNSKQQNNNSSSSSSNKKKKNNNMNNNNNSNNNSNNNKKRSKHSLPLAWLWYHILQTHRNIGSGSHLAATRIPTTLKTANTKTTRQHKEHEIQLSGSLGESTKPFGGFTDVLLSLAAGAASS